MPDKKKLPEISVSSGPIVQHAREMADIRAKIAVLKTQEETACQKIKAAAEPMRQARIDGDDDPRFVGMIRIVANGLTPVRCEFKLTKNTALELTEEKRLTEMYGASRPLLFGLTADAITHYPFDWTRYDLGSKNGWEITQASKSDLLR